MFNVPTFSELLVSYLRARLRILLTQQCFRMIHWDSSWDCGSTDGGNLTVGLKQLNFLASFNALLNVFEKN